MAFDVYVAHYGNSVLGSAHVFAQDGLNAEAERQKSKQKIRSQTETKWRRLRSARGRDLRCGQERGANATQGV